MDISKLIKPMVANVPQLGTIRIDVRSIGFLAWMERADRAGGWSNGRSFTRAFLTERCSYASDDENENAGIGSVVVDGIDDATIEAIAAAIYLVAEPTLTQLRTKLFDKSRKRDETVSRSENQIDMSEKSASHQLFQTARAYLQSYQADRKRHAGELQKLIDPLGIQKEVARYREFSRLGKIAAGTLPSLDHLKSLRQSAEGITEIGGSLRRITESYPSLTKIGGVDLASQMRNHHFNTLEVMKKAELLGSLQTASSLFDNVVRDRELWASTLSKKFNLGLSRSVREMLGADIGAISGSEVARTIAGLSRPGFKSIAAFGLGGVVGQGIAADILNEYDKAATAALFGATIDCVSILDGTTANGDERSAKLNTFLSILQAARIYLGAQYEQAGLIATLSLILSIIALYPEYADPGSKDYHKDILAIEREMEGLRSDIREKNLRSDVELRRTRYVTGEVRLRAAPSRTGLIIRIVYPDQLIHIIDTREDWARVQVFDYKSSAPLEGWIYRRNLRVNPN